MISQCNLNELRPFAEIRPQASNDQGALGEQVKCILVQSSACLSAELQAQTSAALVSQSC